MRVHAKFLTSATDARQFPPAATPEVAFRGRSNVGKSSVLNSLVGEQIARTSSTPGRTRTINFFEIRRPGQPRPDVVFADLPGYGYAKLPREIMAEWASFIEPYLANRAALKLCIVLVDSNIAPQENDKQMIEWLRQSGRLYVVVATKADRVSGNQLRNNLRRLNEEHQVELLPYSARTGSGKTELWRAILEAAGQRSEQEV